MAYKQTIRDKINEMTDGEGILLDNVAYDNSIIGVTVNNQVIYNYDKMIREYMNDNNVNEIEAIEWIEYNTLRALPYCWDSEHTPIIMFPLIQ